MTIFWKALTKDTPAPHPREVWSVFGVSYAKGNKEQQVERLAPEIFAKVNVTKKNQQKRAAQTDLWRFREYNDAKLKRCHSQKSWIKACEYRADLDKEWAWPAEEATIVNNGRQHKQER